MGRRRNEPVGFSAADRIELDRIASRLDEDGVAIIPHSTKRTHRITRLRQAGLVTVGVTWRNSASGHLERKTLEVRLTREGTRLLSDGKRFALLLLGA